MSHPPKSSPQTAPFAAFRRSRSASFALILALIAGWSAAPATALSSDSDPRFVREAGQRPILRTLDAFLTATPFPEQITTPLGPVDALPGDHPFHVTLLQKRLPNNAEAYYCEGALYKQQYVITTANCSDYALPGEVQVLVGARRIDDGSGVRYNVKRIVVHPGWNPNTFDNDIAVWVLEKPAPGIPSPGLAPINSPAGTYFRTTSWFIHGNGDFYNRGRPKLSRSPLIQPGFEACNAKSAYSGSLTSSMLCGAIPVGSTTACAGDPGSPLTDWQTGNLVGIASFGQTVCIFKHFSGVYTRIAEPRIWTFITAVTGG